MALPPQYSTGGNSPPLGRGTILTCDPELVVYLCMLTILYNIYLPTSLLSGPEISSMLQVKSIKSVVKYQIIQLHLLLFALVF